MDCKNSTTINTLAEMFSSAGDFAEHQYRKYVHEAQRRVDLIETVNLLLELAWKFVNRGGHNLDWARFLDYDGAGEIIAEANDMYNENHDYFARLVGEEIERNLQLTFEEGSTLISAIRRKYHKNIRLGEFDNRPRGKTKHDEPKVYPGWFDELQELPRDKRGKRREQ